MDSLADPSQDSDIPQRRKFKRWERDRLKEAYQSDFKELLCRPYQWRSDGFSEMTLGRVARVVEAAYTKRCYLDILSQHSISKPSFHRLADLHRFPVVDKSIISNFKIDFNREDAFEAWTCGTSGGRHSIFFDLDAVVTDTLQGARQLILQSDNRVGPADLSTHYYVYEWYVDRIGEDWVTTFISKSDPAAKAAQHIREKLSSVLYGYPSDMCRLMAELEPKEVPLKLIITNSEQSSRAERQRISDHFGCPVRDEYSSEELTRIALEMPDGHYYVHEDSVYLEVLDPSTRQPTPDGQWGEAVVTGLLNRIMPFVRFATGDLIKKSPYFTPNDSQIGWRRLDGVGGRVEDSFLHPSRSLIPSSELLERIENGICERGLNTRSYCLDQKSLEEATLSVFVPDDLQTEVADFAALVKEVLASDFSYRPNLSVTTAELDPCQGMDLKGKRRPIRSTLHRERRTEKAGKVLPS